MLSTAPWKLKDADPDIPILKEAKKEAKAEYAKLQLADLSRSGVLLQD
jgi:hypothetical protein